jgi:hypothetical protein
VLKLFEEPVATIVAQGFLGFLVIVLAVVCYRLYSDARKSEQRCTELVDETNRTLKDLTRAVFAAIDKLG